MAEVWVCKCSAGIPLWVVVSVPAMRQCGGLRRPVCIGSARRLDRAVDIGRPFLI